MSAIINHFVVHQLVNDGEKLAVKARNDLFDVGADIELFVQQLSQSYNNKPVKGIGGFVEDEEQQEFKRLLAGLIAGDSGFLPFSVQLCDRLVNAMVETGTPEAGFVVVAQYQYLATDYLMVALLDTKEHVEINPQLNLTVSNHLDLAKMQLAARIDLSQYQSTPELNRYISFIKGRAGRKISDFFMIFLGCAEEVDIKQQNKLLLDKVEQYMETEQFAPEEKQQKREELATYYKEQIDSGEDIVVEDVAKTLAMADQTQDFHAFTQQAEEALESAFQGDKSSIKTLSKFTGQGGGISVSFERKLLGDRVAYNPETDTLMIKGVPPNLKDQLNKWKD
ncbi:nucleoid-associated protein YejK [Planctobacterium marinum]|uniref:Nucleoid-associated protein n=1 Tax=Planctobacterium marinum TaxID=1631968 RepID=A0AA48HY78_9ALTE|nr:nucleoid-associated protein [Planctobacterium marinum]